MFDNIMYLLFIGMTPYYFYKSFKRPKLAHKLSGLTTCFIFIFMFFSTRPPINLDFQRALGLFGISVGATLFFLAVKEKNPFLYMSALILAAFGTYIFSSHYL